MSDVTEAPHGQGAESSAESTKPHPDTVLAPPVTGKDFFSTVPGEDDPQGLIAETSEGEQELFRRSETAASELRREVGAVLRLPEGVVIDASDIDVEQTEDQTMIINMGPQHPSTHGVLRLMLELDGETVLRTKPVIGYLHTGMEKTGEELTYVQGSTNVTRMDYLAPLHNELVFSLATEALLGVEMPPRADWIRMLMVELNRLSSHLMWLATNGMDLGSTSMMIYGFREREMVLAFFEKATGLRMNHNFIRPGGTAADLPDGWEDDVSIICDTVLARTDEYDELLTGQPVFRRRSEGVGTLSAEEALALSLTGPILRSTGVPWDLRRSMPYLRYDEVEFDVIVGTYGDNFDRYSIRLNEVRESVRIIRQIIEKMPAGDYRVQDKKVTPPPRARIDESMEALIHHFKVFTEGFRVPEGEVYVAVESPRGELGCYLVSDGSPKPYRMHIRGPSFVNLQGLPLMMRGGLLADAVAVCSTIDPVMGEVDR
jgi:NADH-quinone oxidoreductase subunit D